MSGSFAYVEKPLALGGDEKLKLKVPLSIGTLQWGTTWLDENFVNSKGCITDVEATEILDELYNNDVTLIDTAEGYGGGTSELRLGRVVDYEKHKGTMIMTKFLPTPWRFTKSSFEWAVRASLKRLKLDCCPIYLLHTPVHYRSIEFWVEAAAECKQKGLIEAFGLSNCNADQVRRAKIAGDKFGITIAVNQIMFNLLDYGSEMLRETERACKETGITLVAYSPIGQGLLTDNLTRESYATNRPAKMTRITWDQLQALRTQIKVIAERTEKTMTQVVLNWTICKGAVPLIGCRSARQARDTLGCLGWRLSESDVEALDNVALSRSTLDSPTWRRAIFGTLASLLMMACRSLQWFAPYTLENVKHGNTTPQSDQVTQQ